MIFEYVVLLLLGFALGVLWTCYRVAHDVTITVRRVMQEEQEKSKEESDEMLLRVEENQGIICVYEMNTDNFVAQGANVTELFEHFRTRFPGRSANVVDGPDEVLAMLREQNEQRKVQVGE